MTVTVRPWMASIVLVTLIAQSARGEKAPMSSQGLRETATHVFVGEITAISTCVKQTTDWEYVHYVAEVRLDAVEKGDGFAPDDLAYVRYWKRSWRGRGDGPPSAYGHSPRPNTGSIVRVYAARSGYDGAGSTGDGGLNVIYRNGFETIKAAPTNLIDAAPVKSRSVAPPVKNRSVQNNFIVAVAGFLAGCVFTGSLGWLVWKWRRVMPIPASSRNS